MSASRAMTSASAGVAGVSTIRPGAAGGEDAAQAAWHAGNAQWRPALFPAERIGGLASLQPATLRLATDVRYGSSSGPFPTPPRYIRSAPVSGPVGPESAWLLRAKSGCEQSQLTA